MNNKSSQISFLSADSVLENANPPRITLDGNEYVVIRADQYERVVAEEASDVAAYDRAMEEMDSSDDDYVSHSEMLQLVEGENPLRFWRKKRGLTMAAIAKSAGISQSYVSDIENGRKDGSVAVLKRLAGILGVTLDDIV